MTSYTRVHSLKKLLSTTCSVPGTGLGVFRSLNAPLLREVVLDGWRESYRPEYWRNFYQRPISLAIRTVSQRSRGIQQLTLQFVRLANPIEDYQYIFSTEGFPSLEQLTLHTTDIDDIDVLSTMVNLLVL